MDNAAGDETVTMHTPKTEVVPVADLAVESAPQELTGVRKQLVKFDTFLAGPMRIPLKILRILGYVVATLLLLIALFVAVGALTGEWRISPVLSGSMLPELEVGSVVIATPTPAADLRQGDVIIFFPPGESSKQTVHRIQEVVIPGDDIQVITKGDNNKDVDSWGPIYLDAKEVYVVQGSVAKVGYLAVWAQRPAVQVAVLIVIVVGFLISAMRYIWYEEQDDEDEDDDVAGPDIPETQVVGAAHKPDAGSDS